jgi:integrase
MLIGDSLAPTLRSHFRVLYRRQRLLGKSEDTVRLYEIAMNEFDSVHGREATIHDLTDEAVIAMMQAILDRGRTNRTANRSRECIVALWNFLARKRVVETYPDVPRLPEPREDPVAWTQPQLRTLFQACTDATGFIGDMTAARYWLILHSLLWNSADRIRPVRLCRCEHLNLESTWATFPSANRKGKLESNSFRMDDTTIALIRPVYKPSGLLLPWPYSWTYIYNLYAKLLKRAGLPHDKFRKFHAVRKSAGSWIKAAGGDATAALGHASEKTTRRHYLDPTIGPSQQPCDILFRPDDGPRAA